MRPGNLPSRLPRSRCIAVPRKPQLLVMSANQTVCQIYRTQLALTSAGFFTRECVHAVRNTLRTLDSGFLMCYFKYLFMLLAFVLFTSVRLRVFCFILFCHLLTVNKVFTTLICTCPRALTHQPTIRDNTELATSN